MQHSIRGLLALLAVLALCASATQSLAAPKEELLEGPIVITSATLSADSKNNVAVFEGSVRARSDKMKVDSEKMTVYYGDDGDIDRIDFQTNVKFINDDRVVTSRKATYFARDEKIVFTGEPMAVEGTSIITGSEIVYMLDTERSIVRDSKVFIKQNGNGKK